MQASPPRPQLRNCMMPFKVQVGPQQVSIHQGQTVLVSEPDGQINSPSEKGLYFLDTRVISSWTIYANGEPWQLLNGGAITHYASRTYLTNRRIPTTDGIIAPCTRISRSPTTACGAQFFSSRSPYVATLRTYSK